MDMRAHSTPSSMPMGSVSMPIRGGQATHGQALDNRGGVGDPFDPFSGMEFHAGFLSMSGSPGWSSQLMDTPSQHRDGIPITSLQGDGMGAFDDGGMAMSFGTTGAGSFNASSLDSGHLGGSPRSLGGFFSTRTDSGYASRDTSSGASQPRPIKQEPNDDAGDNMAGSCELGTSPAQRYKLERANASSLNGSSFGKEAVFGSLSPNMLASLDDGPFGPGMMGMDMDDEL